jgi:uncharacterized protein
MDYTKYDARAQSTAQYDEGLRSFMIKMYNYMSAALATTGAVAYLASASSFIMSLMFKVGPGGQLVGMTTMGWIVSLSPLFFVFALGSKLQKVSVPKAQMMFGVFSVLMGLSLASIFLYYTSTSIAKTFFMSATVFGAMSIYGYTTKKDLSSIGSFLMMGLFGIILASLVNLFLQSSAMQFAISIIGVLIFIGLTAYDTQKFKRLYYQMGINSDYGASKLAILGALTLYMDFINLFLYLLRFMGDRRN